MEAKQCEVSEGLASPSKEEDCTSNDSNDVSSLSTPENEPSQLSDELLGESDEFKSAAVGRVSFRSKLKEKFDTARQKMKDRVSKHEINGPEQPDIPQIRIRRDVSFTNVKFESGKQNHQTELDENEQLIKVKNPELLSATPDYSELSGPSDLSDTESAEKVEIFSVESTSSGSQLSLLERSQHQQSFSDRLKERFEFAKGRVSGKNQQDLLGSRKSDEIVNSLCESVESTVENVKDHLETTVNRLKYFHRNVRLVETSKKLKSQIWSSVVTVVLVEGKGLLCRDDDPNICSPFVRFRLANEKFKSKNALKPSHPQWLEQFDMHMFDDQSKMLDITVCDAKNKDEVLGRCTLDLSKLEFERTHRLWTQLENDSGSIFLLLTISGTTSSETISDLSNYNVNPKEREAIANRYSVLRSFQNTRDIGHLSVKVYKAQGLASADLGGKSDPFCVLELVNARLQTQTEYKTLSPTWNKIFTFNVKDVHSVLEVTVYDEDRDHKVEFLGRISIPLLKIRNGEKRWYALKDKKLRSRAKGQILIEMDLVWNQMRAAIRTFNPKEEKYMQQDQKFKRQVFVKNVMRAKAVIMAVVDTAKFVQSIWEWESPFRSVLAFIIFLVLTYYFEVFMVPLSILLIFLKNYMIIWATGKSQTCSREYDEDYDSDEEDLDDEDKDKEEKKTLKERLHTVQEVTQTVQNVIGYLASLGEAVKNTFTFTVPFISWLAVIVLTVITVVIYFIPVRYLILLWGVNKFTRKLRSPHNIPNNEVLDFLSRVPDDEDLINYRELKPIASEADRTKAKPKKKAS